MKKWKMKPRHYIICDFWGSLFYKPYCICGPMCYFHCVTLLWWHKEFTCQRLKAFSHLKVWAEVCVCVTSYTFDVVSSGPDCGFALVIVVRIKLKVQKSGPNEVRCERALIPGCRNERVLQSSGFLLYLKNPSVAPLREAGDRASALWEETPTD